MVTCWEQCLVRGIWGESSGAPGFVAAVGRTAGSQQQLPGTAQQGEITGARTHYSQPSHLGALRNHSGVVWLEKQRLAALNLGREQGLVGFKGLLRLGKHTAQPLQDLEQFTPCPHTLFAAGVSGAVPVFQVFRDLLR